MIRTVKSGSATAGPAANELRIKATRTVALRTRTISGLIVRRGPAGSASVGAAAGWMVSGDATLLTGRRLLVPEAPEFPLPGVALGNRPHQVTFLEVGPKRLAEVELR